MNISRRYVDEEIEEDDIPKSVRKMKKSKTEGSNPQRSKHSAEETPKRKSPNKKRKKKKIEEPEEDNRKIKVSTIIKIAVIILTIYLLISLIISTVRWRKLASDMLISEFSIVVDSEGNEIAKIGDTKIKISIPSKDMPKHLKEAYVAIEDERFYKHHGVDGKRTVAAIGTYVTHFGSSSFGGSTITQQLVKNMTGDSTSSATRKVKEWWKAWNLEGIADKDEILECYLNTIYVGPNVYGVEAGAKYYFNKSAKDLSLEECAFLAGINHSPNSYNPYTGSDNSEMIKKRTKTVLSKLKELKKISKSEYDEAVRKVDEGLKFEKAEQEAGRGVYSYHTDALINETVNDISEKYKISKEFALNYLELSGATIHSTQNKYIQENIEEEFNKEKYILESNIGGEHSQAAMVVIDHTTGRVLGCVGGLGEKTESRPLNRATQSVRQTGSSIKPIAVVAPAIDKKIITAASIVDDTERDFEKGYHPIDYTSPLGKITVRRAIESSQNVPFVEIMEELTPKTSMKYLKKMGVSTLTNKDESLALALGGLDRGISPLEMAGAYATIANNGRYIEPTFYTEITRNNGKKLVESKQKETKVFSEEVAYIMQELLTQPIVGNHGTARYCGINGIDIAAKTGTTDDNFDRWLCGFSPYYTCVCWYGYDQNESIDYNKRNPSGLLWANVMSRIHIGLEGKRFEKPKKVEEATICDKTGKLARTGCQSTHTEYFLKNTEPGACTEHSGAELEVKREDENSGSGTIQAPQNEIIAPEEERRENQENPNYKPTTTQPGTETEYIPPEPEYSETPTSQEPEQTTENPEPSTEPNPPVPTTPEEQTETTE